MENEELLKRQEIERRLAEITGNKSDTHTGDVVAESDVERKRREIEDRLAAILNKNVNPPVETISSKNETQEVITNTTETNEIETNDSIEMVFDTSTQDSEKESTVIESNFNPVSENTLTSINNNVSSIEEKLEKIKSENTSENISTPNFSLTNNTTMEDEKKDENQVSSFNKLEDEEEIKLNEIESKIQNTIITDQNTNETSVSTETETTPWEHEYTDINYYSMEFHEPDNTSKFESNDVNEVTNTTTETKEEVKIETKQISTVKTETKEKKKKSYTGLIILAAVMLLFIGVAVYFYLNQDKFKTLMASIGMGKKELNVDTIKRVVRNDTAIIRRTVIVDTTTTIVKKNDKNNDKIVKEDKKVVTDKWGLKRPCVVISFASLTNEKDAKQLASKLKNRGYKAGYYFIPDVVPSGKQLYKVYVGPYANENEPQQMLATLKSQQKDAYILKIEAN